MSTLRKWFGPSREEVWRQLSTETSGQYVDGGFWKGDKVEVTHGEWTITLDVFTVSTGKVIMHFTRLRAPYVNPDGFEFTVYRKGFFSELGKMLGMQDVEVGYPEFDRDFIIKGNSNDKLRQLFKSARVRELIAAQPEINFAVKDAPGMFRKSFPEKVDMLEFHAHGIIKDIPRLKLLFDLFAETLDELCRIGSAYENRPDVKL